MASQYPSAIRVFDRRQDGRDVVVANDVNVIYDEVETIETQLGVGGVTSSVWSSDGSSFATSSTWDNLAARLTNIEAGIIKSTVGSVSTSGGSVVTASGASVVGVTVKAASSQTAHLINVTNNSGTSIARVESDGRLVAAVISGGTP